MFSPYVKETIECLGSWAVSFYDIRELASAISRTWSGPLGPKAHHVQLDNALLGGYLDEETDFTPSYLRFWGNTELTLTDQSIVFLRWSNGDWEVAAENPLSRGDAQGWRTNDGIMVFGGWGSAAEDLSNVVLINNEFVNAGKLLEHK